MSDKTANNVRQNLKMSDKTTSYVRVKLPYTLIQELSYRKQIARKLRRQYAEGVYDNPVTLKSQSER